MNPEVMFKTNLQFTDAFFKFPVKVYDSKKLQQAYLQAKEEGQEMLTEEPPYTNGWARQLFSNILGWEEFGGEQFSLKNREGNLDKTIVSLHTGEDVMCTWNRDKFEQEINKAYGKIATQ
jgi:hypothetical protein